MKNTKEKNTEFIKRWITERLNDRGTSVAKENMYYMDKKCNHHVIDERIGGWYLDHDWRCKIGKQSIPITGARYTIKYDNKTVEYTYTDCHLGALGECDGKTCERCQRHEFIFDSTNNVVRLTGDVIPAELRKKLNRVAWLQRLGLRRVRTK